MLFRSSELKDGEVYVSYGYAEKFKINKGDKITLKEKYEDMMSAVYRLLTSTPASMSSSSPDSTVPARTRQRHRRRNGQEAERKRPIKSTGT